MGFFSWKTQDTNKSICNTYSGRPTFKVVMTDNKGNTFTEKYYEGYGEFGGMDYFVLTDTMNGGSGDRDEGLRRRFSPEEFKDKQIFPSLSESGKYFDGKLPKDCDYQGYFYDEVCEKYYGSTDIDDLKDKLLRK